MADSYIQVAPDSTGKKMQTYENSVSGQTVEAEAIVLVDSTGTPITTLPISAVSLPLPSLAATSTKQSDGTQKSQIVDGSGNIIGSSSNALNVNLVAVGATSNVSVTKFTGAPNMFNGQVAVTNVASTLVAARTTRRSVSIRNIDATNSGYIGLPVISGSNGMLLGPKESISVDYVGLIQVITSSGNANFAYMETYD